MCSLGPLLACDAQPGHLHEHPHGEIGFTLLLLRLLRTTPLQRWISHFVCLGFGGESSLGVENKVFFTASSFDPRCKGKGGVWDIVEILEHLFHFRQNGYKGPKQKGGGQLGELQV